MQNFSGSELLTFILSIFFIRLLSIASLLLRCLLGFFRALFLLVLVSLFLDHLKLVVGNVESHLGQNVTFVTKENFTDYFSLTFSCSYHPLHFVETQERPRSCSKHWKVRYPYS